MGMGAIPVPSQGALVFAGAVLMGVLIVAAILLALRKSAGAGTGTAGGLNYVVGPMGSGKSLFGVRAIVDALVAGRYVVTNVRLYDGWESMVCRKEFPADWRKPNRRAARERWLAGFYIYETSLSTAMRYRLPVAGETERPRILQGKPPQRNVGQIEGRGVFVWDESHNDLNNRDYQGHGDTREAREEEKQRRRLVLRWATQLRKPGHGRHPPSPPPENTDAQPPPV